MTDREITHSGVQNVGYIEQEVGEPILTNFDPSRPAYIVGQVTMTPEEYERVVSTMQASMKRAAEYFQRKRDNLSNQEPASD
jgi:hypothetical protein